MGRLTIPKQKLDPEYRQLWRVVDGAVEDTFNMHPHYKAKFNPRFVKHIRSSIVKRVVGSVHGYQAEKGRSGLRPAADTDVARSSGILTRLFVRARKLVSVGHALTSANSREVA